MTAPMPKDLKKLYERVKKAHPSMGWAWALPLFERIAQLEAANKELENRHVTFLVQGGAVVMKTDYDKLEAAKGKLERRIKDYIDLLCPRCKRGDKLYREPSTANYTHVLGGNYCSASDAHKAFRTEPLSSEGQS